MRDYDAWIKSTAKDIIMEVGPGADYHDEVFEAVDNSWFVTHHAGNDEVLDSTSAPDERDVAELLDGEACGDWRKVKQTAAFVAMRRDLEKELRSIQDEFFRCDGCDEVTEGEPYSHGVNGVCADCLNRLRAEDNAEEEEETEQEEAEA